ncbi:hypothetical protein BS50DRAFT_374625 [Corynespora cassiicola Philippines]|uniref:Uncharacterized protein n=1 Tax=Corynespora cassiicola Philippines TaxID=1448308 RepID=A0A2T2NP19_CORCC|nr:hypothetical protein BS50DRAFT_374625 [Corynespora cassiicola Philippines]
MYPVSYPHPDPLLPTNQQARKDLLEAVGVLTEQVFRGGAPKSERLARAFVGITADRSLKKVGNLGDPLPATPHFKRHSRYQAPVTSRMGNAKWLRCGSAGTPPLLRGRVMPNPFGGLSAPRATAMPSSFRPAPAQIACENPFHARRRIDSGKTRCGELGVHRWTTSARLWATVIKDTAAGSAFARMTKGSSAEISKWWLSILGRSHLVVMSLWRRSFVCREGTG